MTVSKSIMTISSVAIALMFGGGVYLMMHMNIMAKSYIERTASQTLGVSVSIGSLEINLKDRKAEAKNLVIGNPDGFEKPYAVKVETINVALGDVTKQLVSFKDIDVTNADVNLEVRKNTTNLQAIKDRIKPANPSQNTMKVIIDKLTLSQAQIKPAAVLFTEEELKPVLVPDIILTEIGKKENGVLVSDAMGQIWTDISHKLDSKAMQSGLLQGMSPDALGDMGLSFGQRFKENLEENVQEKVNSVSQGVHNLFND